MPKGTFHPEGQLPGASDGGIINVQEVERTVGRCFFSSIQAIMVETLCHPGLYLLLSVSFLSSSVSPFFSLACSFLFVILSQSPYFSYLCCLIAWLPLSSVSLYFPNALFLSIPFLCSTAVKKRRLTSDPQREVGPISL